MDLSTFDPASLRILERLDELETVMTRVDSNLTGQRTGRHQLRALPHSDAHVELLLPWLLEDMLPGRDTDTSSSLLQVLGTSPGDLPNLATTSPLSVVAELELRTVKSLVDNFFNYVHVKNPVLQEEATRRLVSAVCLHGIEWTAGSCLTLLVCALGACATPFGDSTDIYPGSTAYVQSESYFKAAQKRLGLCMASPGIIEAQCLFLAGVYLMHVFKPFDAWRFFSQALACCQGFDFLTRAASERADANQNHADFPAEQQAIYWSAWKSEQEIRCALKPHDFSPPGGLRGMYPMFFPTPPSPSEAENTRNADTAHREQVSWFFYLTEISLRRLSSRMASEMLEIAQQADDVLQSLADALPEFKSELTAWVDALPPLMYLNTPPILDDVCKFVIRGHIANVYEMLYWPFLLPYIDPKTEAWASSANAERIQSLSQIAIQRHIDRIWLNKPGFKHRHHGTWPMIRSCSRSALVLMRCAAHGGIAMPSSWHEAVQEVLELNRYWQSESADTYHRLPLLEQEFHGLDIVD